MLHACFTPVALCFVYTSWCFYAFSRTNILTRCNNTSSCFLLFLYFRKVIHEIFLELDETKAEVPIYLTWRRSSKERWSGARRRPHHGVARPHPWPRRPMVWAPKAPFDIAPLPINSLHQENPRPEHLSTKSTVSHRRHRPEFGRVQKLFPAPCRRGESSPEAFFITMPASGVMRE
jgi:hypothetical protein